MSSDEIPHAVAHVVFGTLELAISLCFLIINIILLSSYKYTFPFGYGIAEFIIFLITGCLAISAGVKKSYQYMSGTLTLTVIATIFAFFGMVNGGIGMSNKLTGHLMKGHLAASGIGFLLAFIHSIFCCVFCCCKRDTASQGQVVIVSGFAQQQIHMNPTIHTVQVAPGTNYQLPITNYYAPQNQAGYLGQQVNQGYIPQYQYQNPSNPIPNQPICTPNYPNAPPPPYSD